MDPHLTIADICGDTEVGQPEVLNLTILEGSLNMGVKFIT